MKKLDLIMLNIFNEKNEIEDFIISNKAFEKQLFDVILISLGFKNKNLSMLEQGSLIAGETEYLNRFENVKEFIGNPELSVQPLENEKSITAAIKRIRIEYAEDILYAPKDNKDNPTLKSLQIKDAMAVNALNQIKEILKNMDIIYKDMEKIRENNRLFAKIQTVLKGEDEENETILKKIKFIFSNEYSKKVKKERDKFKTLIIQSVFDLMPNLRYINFKGYVTDMAKLKIIESSMGH